LCLGLFLKFSAKGFFSPGISHTKDYVSLLLGPSLPPGGMCLMLIMMVIKELYVFEPIYSSSQTQEVNIVVISFL
jgi:hypothetical protein